MQATPTRKSRILRSFLAATTAVVICGAFTPGTALAADDEETFEQGIIRGLMRGLGLKDSRDEGINYRERAPLVVPPTRDLPPPATSGSIAQSNPVWPNDPDVKKAEAARKAASRPRRDALMQMYDEAKPLSPAELEKGRTATRGTVTTPSTDYNRVVQSPAEMGYTGGLFGSLWSKVGPQRDERGQFKGEPERSSLIAPPSGYQTPSPSQPYGLTAATPPNERLNEKLKDRATGGTYNPN